MGHRHERLRILLVALALAACVPVDGPLPKPPAPAPTSGCERACARLRTLDCEEAKPTPAGAPCEEVCDAASAPNYSPGWPVDCIASSTSCESAHDC